MGRMSCHVTNHMRILVVGFRYVVLRKKNIGRNQQARFIIYTRAKLEKEST